MTKLSKSDALSKLNELGIPLETPFHALSNDVVMRLVEAASAERYRKPKNANGSTGRYYHAYLLRAYHSKKEI